MSDDRMDARLRAAGERWRTRNAEPVETVDVSDSVVAASRESAPARPPRRTWLAVAASVAVVAAAAASVGFAVTRHSGNDRTASVGGGEATLRGVWTFDSRTVAGKPAQAPVTAQLSIDANGMLVANDGCNTMSGHVDITADAINVGDIATTAMACVGGPQSVDDFTEAIHRLLSGQVHWTVGGDRLTLSHGDDTFFYRRFDTGGVHDPNLLPGTTWRLDTIADAGNDGSASSGSDYQAISIMFTDGPGFVVSYLCVTESGQAIAHDNTLTLKVLRTDDAKPCPSTSSELDQRVRARLTGPLTWSIAAGQLVIDRAGVGSLTFTSPPIPTSTSTS